MSGLLTSEKLPRQTDGQWTVDTPVTNLAECVLVRSEVGRGRDLMISSGAGRVRRSRGHHGRVAVAVGVGGTGHVAGVGPGHEVVGGGRSAGAPPADTDLLTSWKYFSSTISS